ncbi:MAG TPA: MlaD family protein [Candidatus Binataceae bacterium]|nr:MlaD family protein [Candidatus Binataceae bacterium]
MARRERTVVVGAFVTGTAVVLLIGILWLAGSRFLRPVDRYRIVFTRSVSGLLPGASVELNGVEVGKVIAVNLTRDSPPRVEVNLEVKPGTPVYRDTVARLEGNLVTGIQFIELTGGSRQSGELGEEQAITAVESSFEDFRRQALEVSNQTYQLVSGLNEDTLNKQNRAALSDVIQNLDATTRNLRTITADLAEAHRLESINTTLANLSEAAGRLNRAADHAAVATEVFSKRSGETMNNLNTVLVRAGSAMDSAQTLLETTNGLMSRNYQDIDRTLLEIGHASRHLDETLQTIQADPSVVIWGSKVSTREVNQ